MELKLNNPKGESILENILGKYRTRQLILMIADISFILLSFISSIVMIYPRLNESTDIIFLGLIYTILNIGILIVN